MLAENILKPNSTDQKAEDYKLIANLFTTSKGLMQTGVNMEAMQCLIG